VTTELTALDELKLYREAHATGPHRTRITAQAMTNVLTCAFRALADKDAEISRLQAELDAAPNLGQHNLLLGRIGGLEDANADLHASKDRVTVALHEARAEIARLRAELDAASDVPVEYAPTAGLEAAMAADPHREDGSVLRETGGQKRAWAWRAATETWEQVTLRMVLRATSPRDEAASAARDRWHALTAEGVPDGLGLWRDVAMAAVLACDQAQPRPRGVPLFAGDEVHLHIPADSRTARLLYRLLASVQRRQRR